MKKNILITLFYLLLTDTLWCQTADSIGIPIGIKEFNRLVYYEIETLKKDTTFDSINVDEMIVIVRLFNTIAENEEAANSKINSEFYKLFLFKWLEKAMLIIKAHPYKLYSYYSKEYDIYVGGNRSYNSQYRIIKE